MFLTLKFILTHLEVGVFFAVGLKYKVVLCLESSKRELPDNLLPNYGALFYSNDSTLDLPPRIFYNRSLIRLFVGFLSRFHQLKVHYGIMEHSIHVLPLCYKLTRHLLAINPSIPLTTLVNLGCSYKVFILACFTRL